MVAIGAGNHALGDYHSSGFAHLPIHRLKRLATPLSYLFSEDLTIWIAWTVGVDFTTTVSLDADPNLERVHIEALGQYPSLFFRAALEP